MGKEVRLSQCMIVKNEENNIERALVWGKKIAVEQIVVDTGSTDRTVEIAEKLGATVYHYTWDDDFSAAKNYAIEKASGSWIAFLDADEYFLEDDTVKLMKILNEVEKETSGHGILIISCGLANLDEAGGISSSGIQTRIFRNRKDLRFHNRIHEQIQLASGKKIPGYHAADFLTIQHTGYSDDAYMKTGKSRRNIRLLRKELEQEPQNQQAMEYLAESLISVGETEEAESILDRLLKQVKTGKTIFRQDSAFFCLMNLLIERNQIQEAVRIKNLYSLFKSTGSNYPDINYLMGRWKAVHKNWKEVIVYLEEAIELQKVYKGDDFVYMLSDLEYIYYLLAISYQELKDNGKSVKYCTLALRCNPYSERVLLPLLTMFWQDENTTSTEVTAFLSKLYDFSQIKAKVFLYKCAKKLSLIELEDYIYKLFSEEERSWFDEKDVEYTQIAKEMWGHLYPGIKCSNRIDQAFLLLMDEIGQIEYSNLCSLLKQNLIKLRQTQKILYDTFVNYFSQFQFWGQLLPQDGNFEVLEGRAYVLKEHMQDFIWLYSKMADYRSKKTLLAILKNWMYLEIQSLSDMEEKSAQYFDLDLISSGKDEVIADLGAYTGDTFESFVQLYGEVYKRYFCYEITPDAAAALRRNTRKYRDVVIRQKAAGSEYKMVSLKENSFDSANSLLPSEEDSDGTQGLVQMVTIDEDILEPLTLIKMDIEGAEADALKGCRRQIAENHPKLAISVYHGYDDLWRLPRMIDQISPGYQFYLRYYGGNLIPTEIVLYALHETSKAI